MWISKGQYGHIKIMVANVLASHKDLRLLKLKHGAIGGTANQKFSFSNLPVNTLTSSSPLQFLDLRSHSGKVRVM